MRLFYTDATVYQCYPEPDNPKEQEWEMRSQVAQSQFASLKPSSYWDMEVFLPSTGEPAAFGFAQAAPLDFLASELHGVYKVLSSQLLQSSVRGADPEDL